jgi:hypothetical protein
MNRVLPASKKVSSGIVFFFEFLILRHHMKKSYNQIIADLFKSKSRGNIVALKVKGNERPVLTQVNEVKGNCIVILNPVSVYGAPIDDAVLHVEDIESLKVYNALYTDPVYVRIRELKNSIDQIRKSLEW